MSDYLNTEKRKRKLCDRGYLYFKDRDGPLKTHWRCVNYQKTMPCARISVLPDGKKERKGGHNHIVNVAGNVAAAVVADIRDSAQSSHDAPKIVVAEAVETCSQIAALLLHNCLLYCFAYQTEYSVFDEFDKPVIPLHLFLFIVAIFS